MACGFFLQTFKHISRKIKKKKKFEFLVDRYVSSFAVTISCGTWNNSELHPLYRDWDLKDNFLPI